MISELVNNLRKESKQMSEYGVNYMATLLTRAADTIELLSDLPSADRPQRWIPCSERLPKASITAPCLMTIMFPRAQDVGVTYGYRYHEDVWVYATFEGYEYTERGVAEVLAWMPRPKPWKGADDE